LDLLPNAIGPGLEDITSADAIIVEHVCFEKDLVQISVGRFDGIRAKITFVYHAAKSTSFLTPIAI
jgi:hypothetical protein